MKGIVVLVVLVIATAIYVFYGRTTREHYGGPVKNVRKIPITDCYRVCNNWAANCERDRPENYGSCFQQLNACRAECYYSNAQRM